MYQRLILLFIICIIAGCGTHHALSQEPAAASVAPSQEQAQVLTVLLHASWKADSTVLFSIDRIVRSPGTLKPYKSRGYDAAFIAYFSDAGGKRLDSCYLNHPLIRRVEHNEQGGPLTTAMIKLPGGSTSARINDNHNASILSILPLDPATHQPEIKLSLK